MALASGLYYFANNETDFTRPAIILLHGAGGNNLSWPPEIRRMQDQRIYALDLPGHGKSEGIGRQIIEDYADCVIDFMDELRIRQAIFVGHSMGGAIALTLGIRNPKRTLGLGLISTGMKMRVSEQLLNNASNQATLPLAIQFIDEWAFGPHADPDMRQAVLDRMNEIRPAVMYADFLACDSFDVTKRAGRVKAPTLIVCGTEDRMTPIHLSEALLDKIKGSHIRRVDGAGHMVMLEEPQTLAASLKLFIQTIPYEPGGQIG